MSDSELGIPGSAMLLRRKLLAEFLGAGLLVAVIVGAGIAAQRLSPEDVGLQLLQNSIATALGLTVLILVLGPISGAHLNPAVTLASWYQDRRSGAGISFSTAVAYIGAQCAGGIGGAVLANVMFAEPTVLASTDRVTGGHLLGEVVATAGLVLVIFALMRGNRAALVGPAVGAYIGAAIWFTSSTSFANPAVTIGRMFSDTFSGIAPGSALPFVLMQLVGAGAGLAVALFLYPRPLPLQPDRASPLTESSGQH